VNEALPSVPFRDALVVWGRVALQSFGGPAGQIAVMHRILVEEKRWIPADRFMHALSFCMLLPGPEAQQLATYIGWLLNGVKGGFAAGLLFILPGFLSILGLSYLYVLLGETTWVAGLFYGLKSAVLALVVEAVLRIGRRVGGGFPALALAMGSLLAIGLFDVPFPYIIVTAAAIGLWRSRGEGPTSVVPPVGRPGLRQLALPLLLLVLWLAPVVGLVVALGPDHVLSAIALFFSKTAVVTFGGAYAVLAYMAQQAVEVYGWLRPGEMIDGLGMAETTPGPLIQVVQFVGFLAAWRDPGVWSPAFAGLVGALLTTWVTFVPCFLWIFLGAPWIERLRGHGRLAGALSSIMAAVLGVVAQLALWFVVHVIFTRRVVWEGPWGVPVNVPVANSLDVAALALAVLAAIALLRFRVGVGRLLFGAALAGIVIEMFGH
jgi:chromate transporter